MSAKSRLPLVMYERDVGDIATSFPRALGSVLLELDLPGAAISAEVDESRDAVVARTDSRSLLGSLNDFAFMAAHHMRVGSMGDLVEVSVRLARTPTGPLGYRYPADVAEELLS